MATDYDVLGPNDEKHVLHVNCTEEGVIIDLFSEDSHLGTWARTAQELAEALYEGDRP